MVGLQDVRELERQAVKVLAKALCLLSLHGCPGMLQQARWQRAVAIDHRTVDLDRGQRAPGAVIKRLVCRLAQCGCCLGPKRRERCARASRGQRANFLLNAQCMLSDALAVRASGRAGQRIVENSRQGLDGLVSAAAVDQHQGKIVTQFGQVPIAGKKSRAQAQRVNRIELRAGALAGQVEGNLCLCFCLHVLTSLPSDLLARRCTCQVQRSNRCVSARLFAVGP